MSLVGVIGDCATTTALALAATWPTADDVLVIEADPRGGSIAAWLDIAVSPSLSSVVARSPEGDWPTIDRLSRVTPSGLRVLPAPPTSVEATQSIAEAARGVFPVLAALDSPVAIADGGAVVAARGLPAVAARSDVIVVVHRQATQSTRAAGVRLERLTEVLELAHGASAAVLLAIVGDRPFEPAEIGRFVGHGDGGFVAALPDDPLSAAVLAGRRGVSARRLARLPLMRAASGLSAVASHHLAGAREARRRAVGS